MLSASQSDTRSDGVPARGSRFPSKAGGRAPCVDSTQADAAKDDLTPLDVDAAFLDSDVSDSITDTAARRRETLDVFNAARPNLFAKLRRMQLSPEDAEDLVQDTWLRIFTARLSRRGKHNPRGFIYKIAVNLGRDELRRRRRRGYGHEAPDTDTLVCDKPLPVETIERVESSTALTQVLNRLTPRCQTALNLHYIHELTYDSIGAQLGVSGKTIERDILHARKFCHAVLSSKNRNTHNAAAAP